MSSTDLKHHRIVELQQCGQAVPMAFLQPVQVGNTACVLRGLQPAEDRISLTPLDLTLPASRNCLYPWERS